MHEGQVHYMHGVHKHAEARGVWGHAPPLRKILKFVIPETVCGDFYDHIIIQNNLFTVNTIILECTQKYMIEKNNYVSGNRRFSISLNLVIKLSNPN